MCTKPNILGGLDVQVQVYDGCSLARCVRLESIFALGLPTISWLGTSQAGSTEGSTWFDACLKMTRKCSKLQRHITFDAFMLNVPMARAQAEGAKLFQGQVRSCGAATLQPQPGSHSNSLKGLKK